MKLTDEQIDNIIKRHGPSREDMDDSFDFGRAIIKQCVREALSLAADPQQGGISGRTRMRICPRHNGMLHDGPCPECVTEASRDKAAQSGEGTRTVKTVASMRYSSQISPDDWDVYRKTMICTDSTTVGQIRAWTNGGPLHVCLDEADIEENDHEAD